MQHFKLSRRLEASLQAIDASYAVPYWDTSQEMTPIIHGLKAKGVDIWSKDFDLSLQTDDLQAHNSPLFTATWFGRSGVVPRGGGLDGFRGDDAFRASAIQDGRWAFTTVPRFGDGSVWSVNAQRALENSQQNSRPDHNDDDGSNDNDAVAGGRLRALRLRLQLTRRRRRRRRRRRTLRRCYFRATRTGSCAARGTPTRAPTCRAS